MLSVTMAHELRILDVALPLLSSGHNLFVVRAPSRGCELAMCSRAVLAVCMHGCAWLQSRAACALEALLQVDAARATALAVRPPIVETFARVLQTSNHHAAVRDVCDCLHHIIST